MPEQAEWQVMSADPNAHSDSGDYTWKPTYSRCAMNSLNSAYDTRTIAQKLDDATKRIAHLEAMFHRYINQNDGTL